MDKHSLRAGLICLLCLLLANDILKNPGPRVVKFPCGECGKAIKTAEKRVACDDCISTIMWFHTKCMTMCDEVYLGINLDIMVVLQL